MVEKDGEVEPIDIVREKVDHLAHCGLAKGTVGKFKCLFVKSSIKTLE